jgi:aryl-alcohol dehydrogenase-like predicted oxidoreductase
VKLGRSGPVVSSLGFGAWGLSGDYGSVTEREAIATLRRALALGVTLIDTADEYGAGHNERLVGRAIRDRRDEVVLATKVGIVSSGTKPGVCGTRDYLRSAVDASLSRLDVESVDLVYLHRVDPETPVEESVGALAEAVQAGKARYVGLCEVGADELRRAHAVHPITAVQSEYSLWTRDPETAVLPAVRELGIGFVAFSPLGRGFLTGSVSSSDQLGEGDFRRGLPRFQPDNLRRNLELVDRLRAIGDRLGATPGQVALAWLLDRGVVPIPGTRSQRHLAENIRATGLELGDEERGLLEAGFPPAVAAGDRYPAGSSYSPDRSRRVASPSTSNPPSSTTP